MKLLIPLFTEVIFLTGAVSVTAQQQDSMAVEFPVNKKINIAVDTTSLQYAFQKGKVHGDIRYFFMATNNAKGLTDYFANAIGGGIKYETAPYKGFRLGMGGSFVFNIGSSDLTVRDAGTNQLNRYEIGLFDITDSANKNINRLEELYLSYSWKSSRVTAGRQMISTPFINPQDGRMRQTVVNGLWLEWKEIKHTKVEAGFIYQLSPRSTMKWYTNGASIGLYPAGINTDGAKAQYAGNVKSKGIGLLGVSHSIKEKLTLQVWNMWVENIFNAAMFQAAYRHPLKNNHRIIAGIQFIRQDAIHNGGNDDPAKTYIQKGSKAQSAGARIGWENSHWQTSVNYNRITAHGRYLMPREWGRDPFFTFLPRERNEGFGDVNAYVVKVAYTIPGPAIKLNCGFGYYHLPDVANYALNKYGLPSYAQLNMDIQYSFKGFFEGLDMQLLYVWKSKSGNSYNNNKYVINKVDMQLWNLVVNYRF